jgi:hypothetical protein
MRASNTKRDITEIVAVFDCVFHSAATVIAEYVAVNTSYLISVIFSVVI